MASAGTILSLGADAIIMTKQATLGPIDPSINTPLNPLISGAGPGAHVPVSVEAVKGYLDLATKQLGLKDDVSLSNILNKLADMVHPLVLGQIFRSREQIQFLARRLLPHQVNDPNKADEIISFPTSESGSHDYTINRREARSLGLKIETPDEELYSIIRQIHISFRSELQLNDPYDPNALLSSATASSYFIKRCLIESQLGGCNAYVSEGLLTKQMQMLSPGMPQGMPVQAVVTDQRTFEGWRKLV
jgi:hypothetical protein